MLTKHLLKISLFLPLMAVSATAYAGSTVTGKSYWPSEARSAAHSRTGTAQGGLRDAFASSMTAPLQAATNVNYGANAWRYHGGPKSPQ
jgi:hypothetical protein